MGVAVVVVVFGVDSVVILFILYLYISLASLSFFLCVHSFPFGNHLLLVQTRTVVILLLPRVSCTLRGVISYWMLRGLLASPHRLCQVMCRLARMEQAALAKLSGTSLRSTVVCDRILD